MGEQTALVTGGNRGLGRGVCRRLARAGMHVMLSGRDLEDVRAALEDLRNAGAVQPLQLDVTDEASIDAAFETFTAAHDHLDVLVNNAGIALDGFDADVARRTLDANFYGAARVTDRFLPAMADGGRIVMVSSGVGSLSKFSQQLQQRFLDPNLDRDSLCALVEQFVANVEAGRHTERGWPTTAYGVSKAAVNALTRILAREHPRLRVNAVCPGWVRTDMGGPSATRSIEEGAASIAWATGHDVPTGGFFRDGHRIQW
jgi:carbonyl reductase 1